MRNTAWLVALHVLVVCVVGCGSKDESIVRLLADTDFVKAATENLLRKEERRFVATEKEGLVDLGAAEGDTEGRYFAVWIPEQLQAVEGMIAVLSVSRDGRRLQEVEGWEASIGKSKACWWISDQSAKWIGRTDLSDSPLRVDHVFEPVFEKSILQVYGQTLGKAAAVSNGSDRVAVVAVELDGNRQATLSLSAGLRNHYAILETPKSEHTLSLICENAAPTSGSSPTLNAGIKELLVGVPKGWIVIRQPATGDGSRQFEIQFESMDEGAARLAATAMKSGVDPKQPGVFHLGNVLDVILPSREERKLKVQYPSLLLYGPAEPSTHVRIPASGAILRFALARLPQQNQNEGGSLSIVARKEGGNEQELARFVTGDMREGEWTCHTLDIGELAGSSVDLVFSTKGNADGDHVLLGSPVVLAQTTRRSKRPNVILISNDTLSARFLGYHGHPKAKTPNIDRLAAESATFLHARAASAWTLTSHKTMLSGYQVPILEYMGEPRGYKIYRAHPATVPTLAHMLANEGYYCAAITGGGFVHPLYEFDRGFDEYAFATHVESDPSLPEGCHKVSMFPNVLRWLPEGLKADPFFLFIHHYMVHSPYAPPEPEDLRTLFPSRGKLSVSPREAAALRVYNGLAKEDPDYVPPDADLEYINKSHLCLVSYVDRGIGRLRNALEAAGILDNTIIVFTSDHGQDHWENGLMGHALGPETTLRIPLFFRYPPRISPKTVGPDVMVDELDIVPTVLDLAGVHPSSAMQGRSLLPVIMGTQKPFPFSFSTRMQYHSVAGQGLKYHVDFAGTGAPCQREWLRTERKPGTAVVEALYPLSESKERGQMLTADGGGAREARPLREALLYYLAECSPGWNVLISNPDGHEYEILVEGAQPRTVAVERGDSYFHSSAGFDIALNRQEFHTSKPLALLMIDAIYEESFKLLVRRTDGGDARATLGLRSPQDVTFPLEISHDLETSETNPPIRNGLPKGLLARGDIVVWYTPLPFPWYDGAKSSPEELSPEVEQQLRGLGYIR